MQNKKARKQDAKKDACRCPIVLSQSIMYYCVSLARGFSSAVLDSRPVHNTRSEHSDARALSIGQFQTPTYSDFRNFRLIKLAPSYSYKISPMNIPHNAITHS